MLVLFRENFTSIYAQITLRTSLDGLALCAFALAHYAVNGHSCPPNPYNLPSPLGGSYNGTRVCVCVCGGGRYIFEAEAYSSAEATEV